MKEYIITLSLKTNPLIVLEVGTQMGGSGNSVGEEIGLNGKNYGRGFHVYIITGVITI